MCERRHRESNLRFIFKRYFNYAPLRKRGAYCFASDGRSVDQAMFAQYLENLSYIVMVFHMWVGDE
jgi:hypothetical protein